MKKDETKSDVIETENNVPVEKSKKEHEREVLKSHPYLIPSPNTSTCSSASKRICRICQMDSGEMVRPCDCAGTMGNVHEECLSKWVTVSNKKKCEICNSEYSKSGSRFKNIKQWEKPKFSFRNAINILIIISVVLVQLHLVDIMNERHFFKRVFKEKMYCRPDDTGRVVVFVLMTMTILHNLFKLLSGAIAYMRNQREVKFINKH